VSLRLRITKYVFEDSFLAPYKSLQQASEPAKNVYSKWDAFNSFAIAYQDRNIDKPLFWDATQFIAACLFILYGLVRAVIATVLRTVVWVLATILQPGRILDLPGHVTRDFVNGLAISTKGITLLPASVYNIISMIARVPRSLYRLGAKTELSEYNSLLTAIEKADTPEKEDKVNTQLEKWLSDGNKFNDVPSNTVACVAVSCSSAQFANAKPLRKTAHQVNLLEGNAPRSAICSEKDCGGCSVCGVKPRRCANCWPCSTRGAQLELAQPVSTCNTCTSDRDCS